MKEQISAGSDAGKSIGFTADLFDGWLWDYGDSIYVSFIVSLDGGRGHFRRLLDTLEGKWAAVKVPTPSRRMVKILEQRGYVQTFEQTEIGECEVWSRSQCL